MGLDRIGTFRGRPLDWGVSVTSKKKMPQFSIRVLLTEFYDQKESTWFDYTDQEAEITAYLCLYGADKKKGGEIGPTLSMDQVKKVFEWDGRSLAQLAAGKYDNIEFQLRIGDNTYEAATSPYQVNWIDEYDANPSGIRKLDAKELKDLDKQFATLGAKSATPKPTVTAAKAPAKKHPARVPADDASPTPAEKKAALAAKSAKNKAATKRSTPPPKPASKDAKVPPPKLNITGCTMQEAWDAIQELRDPTISDDVITEVWHGSIAEIAGPEATSENITNEQWYQIKDKTLESVAKF